MPRRKSPGLVPGSFEKSVKKATKAKPSAPKSTYVEHIFVATHVGEAGVAEVFRTLTNRLRDSTWTIVFKSLIIVHLMIREGEPDVTLKFLADSPSKLAISNFSDAQIQGSNIRHYYTYLHVRAKSYRDTRLDWVREGQGRLKKQTIDKGLLRETETVQGQISALLKCNIVNEESSNEITMTAFRLLTMDLLILFHIMNEGTINVLEHYFEMSKFDAERALNIYKTFGKQTNQVVEYLSKARAYENSTRLEIPKLKHAPTSLTGSLEEYLQDPDFEINRRQYLAQQEAKKGRKNMSNGNAESSDYSKNSNTAKKTETREGGQTLRFSDIGPPTPAKSEPKGPAPDLIDLFDSIEQNQQPMATQPQQVSNFQQVHQYYQLQQPQQPPPSTYPQPQDLYGQNSQLQQQTGGSLGNVAGNTFGQPQSQTQTLPQPSQPNFTGAGIGGYPQQSFGHQQNLPSNHQQPSLSEFSNQQSQFGGVSQQAQNSTDFAHQQSPFAASVQRQPTNPFRQSVMPQSPSQISQFTAAAAAPPLPTSHPYQSTNPFARTLTSQPPALQTQSPFVFSPSSQPQSGQQQPQPLQPNPGGTNPFGFSSSQPQPPPQPPQLSPQQAQPLKSTPTGTNPFARNLTAPQQAVRPITPTQTGSTNPFRQSTFGPGWYAPQPSMGSLDHIETVPVFPRPGQQSAGQAPTQRQGWS